MYMITFKNEDGTTKPVSIKNPLAVRAVRLLNLFDSGMLPRGGGWYDQDPDDVYLIEKAREIRDYRKSLADRAKAKRRALRRR